MKFLLSLSLIPLLLLTNVSAAEKLQLPTHEEENFPLHEYENPTTEDGYPLLAKIEGEPSDVRQDRADELCVLLGHKEARKVFKKDVQFNFEGKAYLEGKIVDVKARLWSFFSRDFTTNAIFKVLRCID